MLRILSGIFLLVVIFEGAIRKWALPAYSSQVFALKDVLLVLAFAAYLGGKPKRVPKASELMIWVFWALLVVAYAVIGGLTIENVIGLRYYLAPLPLIVLIPELVRSTDDLDHVAAWAVRLTFPIGILAILQYFSPPDSPLNSYAWAGEEAGSTFGVADAAMIDRPRVTATFSYISTYASFLAVAWVLGWLSLLHSSSRINRWLASLALILVAFNMAMNGSRWLLSIAAISGFPFALAWLRQLGTFRSQMVSVVVMVVVGYVGTSIFEPFALTAERGDIDEAMERISGALLTPYATLSQVELAGEGLGYTFGGFEQLGLRAARAFDEINLDRVGVELGIFGYGYLLILKVAMLWKTMRVYIRGRSAQIRHWTLAALLVQVGSAWQIPFYNAVAAIFYFCAIGLVYWLDQQLSPAGRRHAGAGDLNPMPLSLSARPWR